MSECSLLSQTPPFHLFEAFGVELEYMIVDADTLDVRPITDRVLHQVAGEYLSEVELGQIAWSNELALHVIELKTNGPARSLSPLSDQFQEHVRRINELLQPHGARLMPTAMHPWMDPHRELKLWPHEYNPIYEAYNRIFDCRGHGWANLQSVHLNLPFADDDQFGRLHAAIRLLMPILPALAASSPIADRRLTGWVDYRMEVYRNNSRRVPAVTADVIPEAVFSRRDYASKILQPMYDHIAPLDAGVLQHEWLNARGAIARFDRNTIEIRVLDVQECPAADLAICRVIANVLSAMTQQRWTSRAAQQSIATPPLVELFLAVIRDGEQTVINNHHYLAQFGVPDRSTTAQELWHHLAEQTNGSQPHNAFLERILRQGPLSRRIERAIDGDMARVWTVYRQLCDCLAQGKMFDPEADR